MRLDLTSCESATFQDGIFCHFVASMISGLVTTIASMPVNTYVTIIIKFITKNLLTAAKLLVFTLPSFCTHFVSLKIFFKF